MEAFRTADIPVFAVSYDSLETIATFCDRYGIEYDFLSDDGSRVIRELGILNTLVRPDESVFGIPYPGTYVLDSDGIVIAKFFNREYQVRESVPFLLCAALRDAPDVINGPYSTLHPGVETPVRIAVGLRTPDLKFRQRAELVVQLDIAPGFHVYGRRIPDGYFPIDVAVAAPETLRVSEPAYPVARPLRIEGLDEDFHVLEGTVRIPIEVNLLIREGDPLPVDIMVRYQACTDTECLIPSTVRLHLDLPIGGLTPQATSLA